MSDQDLIVVRETDTPLDGMWYDRKLMKELERIRVPFLETAGQFMMAPTGVFEEREDGKRGEVWVPRSRLLAYLLRPVAWLPFRTEASTEAT